MIKDICQRRVMYLEERRQDVVYCMDCEMPRKPLEKGWLYSDSTGFVCPKCVKKHYFRRMKIGDLRFKKEWIVFEETNDHNMVEAWRAYDQEGEILAQERTKKECLASARVLLKYGIVYNDEDRMQEIIESNKQTLTLVRERLVNLLDPKYSWWITGISNNDNDLYDRIIISSGEDKFFLEIAEIQKELESRTIEQIVEELANDINETMKGTN